tara:strand:- start:167 stop:280 length:114 start_codon:yes stop_codon:yes gene_type:complete
MARLKLSVIGKDWEPLLAFLEEVVSVLGLASGLKSGG